MWGAVGCGKTTFLAALYIAVNRSEQDLNIFGVDDTSTEFMVESNRTLTNEHRFPEATQQVGSYSWTMNATTVVEQPGKSRFGRPTSQGNWKDGASVQWNNDLSNNTYGSRELAAQMALSGDLKRARGMILADMIGPPNVQVTRDTGSTKWLVDFIWETAAQLGHQSTFVNRDYTVGGDDHFSFIRRGVAGCDLIDFSVQTTYWHTPQDTLDKIDPKSLGIVGQVLAATLPRFEKKFP